jgi:hypothetical protein
VGGNPSLDTPTQPVARRPSHKQAVTAPPAHLVAQGQPAGWGVAAAGLRGVAWHVCVVGTRGERLSGVRTRAGECRARRTVLLLLLLLLLSPPQTSRS